MREPATAFDLEFDAWPPPSPPVTHGIPAPIGAIRIATKGKSRVRMIKIGMGGPPSRRWMNLARFWWLKNMGEVPDGKRVGHFDLDSLNDDPHNYALFSAGDMIASFHLDNPRWSARQHKRAAKGTARVNVQRSIVFRSLRFRRYCWYAVDRTNKTIVNDPMRKRWMVCDRYGPAVEPVKSDRLESPEFASFRRIWPEIAFSASSAPPREIGVES